jgi:hypothetical protein
VAKVFLKYMGLKLVWTVDLDLACEMQLSKGEDTERKERSRYISPMTIAPARPSIDRSHDNVISCSPTLT